MTRAATAPQARPTRLTIGSHCLLFPDERERFFEPPSAAQHLVGYLLPRGAESPLNRDDAFERVNADRFKCYQLRRS
jgi:hypothetical protein